MLQGHAFLEIAVDATVPSVTVNALLLQRATAATAAIAVGAVGAVLVAGLLWVLQWLCLNHCHSMGGPQKPASREVYKDTSLFYNQEIKASN